MKILKPYFYDDFECIGGKCIDSCCIGWKISIDKKTYNKYKKVNGKFGDKLIDNIQRDRKINTLRTYGKMKLDGNSRCALLDQNNLCEVYINLGPEYMCDVCKIYPRLVKKHGNIYERSLTLSCPVVAEFLVKNKEPLNFLLEDSDINYAERVLLKENESFNSKLYDLLWESRSLAIEIAQFREIPMWKRLVFINLLSEKVQNLIDNKQYDNYDVIFDTLRKNVIDDSVQKSLENIPVVNDVKVSFSNFIIEYKIKKNGGNSKFISLVKTYNEYVTDKEKNLENKEEIFKIVEEFEVEFDKYLYEKEYILENYVVYNLYNNYMESLSSKDVHKEIIRLMISYSIIKKLLFGKWGMNEQKLSDEDFIETLYSFSRTLEHSETFVSNIYSKIKSVGYDTLAYLTVLIR